MHYKDNRLSPWIFYSYGTEADKKTEILVHVWNDDINIVASIDTFDNNVSYPAVPYDGYMVYYHSYLVSSNNIFNPINGRKLGSFPTIEIAIEKANQALIDAGWLLLSQDKFDKMRLLA